MFPPFGSDVTIALHHSPWLPTALVSAVATSRPAAAGGSPSATGLTVCAPDETFWVRDPAGPFGCPPATPVWTRFQQTLRSRWSNCWSSRPLRLLFFHLSQLREGLCPHSGGDSLFDAAVPRHTLRYIRRHPSRPAERCGIQVEPNLRAGRTALHLSAVTCACDRTRRLSCCPVDTQTVTRSLRSTRKSFRRPVASPL